MSPSVGSAESRKSWIRWIFPAVLLILFAVLVAIPVSGSSIAVLRAAAPVLIDTTVTSEQDSDLLWGQPRPIRSDEWAIATPLSVSQTKQGFPADPWIGLTRTPPALFTYTPPVIAVSTLALPQTWGYLILGPAHGLAWFWWFPFLLSGCAVYALLLTITKNILKSSLVATLATFSPFVGWWTAPSPNLSIGYAAAGLFFLLLALRASSVWVRLLGGGGIGYCVAALAFSGYPPWAVSMTLVAGSLGLGLLIDNWPGWRPVVGALVPAFVVAAVLGLFWFQMIASDLPDYNGTIYPGQRSSVSGEGSLRDLFSAPANLYTSVTNTQPIASNQSQSASSWLPIVMVALIAAVMLVVGRRRDEPARWRVGRTTVVILGAMFTVLLAWSQWPALPEVVGRLLLLNKVPGYRLPVALGFALILLAVCLGCMKRATLPRGVLPGIVVMGSLAAVVSSAWSLQELYGDVPALWRMVVLAGSLLMALAFASVALDRYWQLVLPIAVVYALASYLVVNPVYRGLGIFDSDPVSQYAERYAAQGDPAPAVTLGGRELPALVRGGGLQVLSGTTQYPQPQFWESVAPDDDVLWNNYRNYSWRYDPAANPVSGVVTAPDAADLMVDLCAPAIIDLGYELVFSPEPVAAPCLEPTATLDRDNGTTISVYRLRTS